MAGSRLFRNKKDPQARWDALVLRVSSATAAEREKLGEKETRIQRALVDYDYFVTTYFPHYTKDKTGRVTNCAPFHVEAANKALADPYFTALLPWFRGSAKSTHANIFLPLWLKIQRPTRQLNVMMLIGKNQKTAIRLLQDIQAELEHNELYIRDFGPQLKDGSWAEGEFQTQDGCAFVALGMGQPPRGTRFGANRPDYIVMDDFDDDKLKKNQARVREVVEWIHRAVLPTMDIGIARFLAVNNLIAKRGIMAMLMAEHPDWYVMRIDALDKAGRPTWDKYDRDYFDRLLKKIKFKAFQSEYMNNPQEDGGVFTNEQIQWKKMLNDWSQYDALVMYGDPSYSTSEISDFFSIPLWAKKGHQFFKLKVYHRQRETPAKAVKWWFDFFLKLPAGLRSKMRCYVEANATQKDLLRPILTREARRRGVANFIKFDTGKKGDKADRIGSMTTQYENGDVFYNIDEQDDPDMMASQEQLTSWTEGAKHDDGPDADESAWRKLEKLGRKSGREEVRTGKFTKTTLGASNMSFITLSDYKSQISLRDLEALTALEDEFPTEPTALDLELSDDGELPLEPVEFLPAPDMSIRETAEVNAMDEVASYLRGRFDMEAAYAATGRDRNQQLVGLVVDVALWNLSPKVAFANVSEVRQIRYEAAIKWLKLAEGGKSNPNLPRYAPDPEKPQAHRLFRYGSNPVRSQTF